MKKYNSITKKEYETALEAHIPVHIFIDQAVSNEYRTWKKNKNKKIDYAHVDNKNIFELIDEIYNSTFSRYVKEFSTADDISDWLRIQWAGLFKKLLISKKKRLTQRNQKKIRINAYKLFYLRHSNKITMKEMAKAINISVSKYRQYETLSKKFKSGGHIFPFANEIDIKMIAMELKVHKNELLPGKVDDFSYQFGEYYARYKGKRFSTKSKSKKHFFPAKIVIFDFDGTLTIQKKRLSAWEQIWVRLGYTVNECAKYHSQFAHNIIDHKKWCDITLEHFKKKGLTEKLLTEIAADINLVKDSIRVLKFLDKKGLSLHLLSGSIEGIIESVLGDHKRYFKTIKSNKILFSQSGLVNEIIGTKYDFQGKADYIKDLIERYDIHPYEALYIGNSSNDRFAYLSGARTLCINPHFTDPDNSKEWSQNIRVLDSLTEILPYIFRSSKEYKKMI